MRDFICVYFGKDWAINARGFASAKQAESHGKYMMPVPGCFGFAIISEWQERGRFWWEVDYDRSMLSGKETVSQDNLGNFAISF
jgi:hypothetical protein